MGSSLVDVLETQTVVYLVAQWVGRMVHELVSRKVEC
jgi:hypothetical protein